MNTVAKFSFKRLGRLMLNDIIINRKVLVIAALTVVVFLLLVPFHVTSDTSTYFFVLYVGGFILTTRAFYEIHKPRKAYYYLTLPCSNLERFLSKWLLTAVVYAVALLLLFYLFGYLSIALNQLLYGDNFTIYSPLHLDLLLGVGKYIILQSIFLLGAATFKRHVLIKTALFLGCLLFIISLFTVILTWTVCPDCFFGGVIDRIAATLQGANMLFWIALAPFCWFIAYLKIVESEVK